MRAAAGAGARRVLDALELFREKDGGISLNSIVAFLCVAGQEGVSMKELAFLCRLTEATTSRSVRALAAPDDRTALPPALGLVELAVNPEDGRGRLVYLTAQGRQLSDSVEAAAG